MADIITLTRAATTSQYAPHPEGQFAARCVDVIDLGERVEEFPGSPTKVVRKLALVFASGERNEGTGTLHTVSAEFTASTHEKASLRRTLESWRGKRYADADLDAGLPVHKLAGQPALITVEHQQSKSGRAYAKLVSVTPLPKAMASAAPTITDYERAPYWADRKAEYAAGVKAYKAQTASVSHEAEPPVVVESDDDVSPF